MVEEKDIVICPECGTGSTEKVCPKCGQVLHGWEYRKKVLVTRSTYSKLYEKYTGAEEDRSGRILAVALCLSTFLMFPFGTMWIVASWKRVHPIWKIVLGLYVGAFGVYTICIQFLDSYSGTGKDTIVLNLLTAMLLNILPSVLSLVKGCKDLKRKGN